MTSLGQSLRLLSRAQGVALAQRRLGAVGSRLPVALLSPQSLGVAQRRMCADVGASSEGPSEELLAKLRVLPQDEREALANKLLEEMDVGKPMEPLSKAQRNQLFIATAIPMIGFGFMDNAVMILCGELIEIELGATLCISTLTAAGIGNLISDLVGLGTGGIIESYAAKYGVEAPRLTSRQLTERSAVFARHGGNACGITLGCLIGMFPLLFHNEEEMRLRMIFKRYDKDGSGSLDWNEIRQAFADAKMYPSEQDMKHLFDKYDLNKDGVIVFDEFRAMVEDLEKALKDDTALGARGFMAAEAHLLEMEHEAELSGQQA